MGLNLIQAKLQHEPIKCKTDNYKTTFFFGGGTPHRSHLHFRQEHKQRCCARRRKMLRPCVSFHRAVHVAKQRQCNPQVAFHFRHFSLWSFLLLCSVNFHSDFKHRNILFRSWDSTLAPFKKEFGFQLDLLIYQPTWLLWSLVFPLKWQILSENYDSEQWILCNGLAGPLGGWFKLGPISTLKKKIDLFADKRLKIICFFVFTVEIQWQ